MASIAAIEAESGRLPAELKLALKNMFSYVLKNLRFGRPDGRVENFSAAFVSGRTSTVSSREVALPHGLERAPYLALPVLDLQTVGASIVALTVTRAADDRNVYVASAETDAPICLMVEG